MLGHFAQQTLALFRQSGYEVVVSAYHGHPVVSIFDPVRNAETCLGVTADAERDIFTRLARDFGLADGLDGLDPSFSDATPPLALSA